VSDRRPDSEAAIETSGDLRLVVTPAYPAFALPVRYAYDGHETLHERGFVVAPPSFLDGHVLLHAARHPRERNAWSTSGIPPRAVKVSSWGLGSTSNSNGDSVSEGLVTRRMPAIVRESHTLRVHIPEHAPSLLAVAFRPIHGL
jgi:hypothetical protein